jgi:transposase InsO family protein
MSKTPNAELAKAALSHAIRRQQTNSTKLMFHSDQGVQYSPKLFIHYLNILNITQSMSRRGHWDTFGRYIVLYLMYPLKCSRFNLSPFYGIF